jgi:hypothetical protein
MAAEVGMDWLRLVQDWPLDWLVSVPLLPRPARCGCGRRDGRGRKLFGKGLT